MWMRFFSSQSAFEAIIEIKTFAAIKYRPNYLSTLSVELANREGA